MTDTNRSSAACCGGSTNAVQIETRQPQAERNSGKGCGCGDAKVIASEIAVPEAVMAEKSVGGCCGGK